MSSRTRRRRLARGARRGAPAPGRAPPLPLPRPRRSGALRRRLRRPLRRARRRSRTSIPELVTPDSPTQRVGAPPADGFRKVEHLSPMGSLEKVTTAEALSKWADDVRKRLGSDEPVAYVLEPKIDGSAVSLVYENGVYVRGATRGDGQRGEDVTANLRTLARPLPLRLPDRSDGATDVLEVRGEIYFPLAGFDRFNEAQLAAGQKPAPNARNAAAGSLRQLNPAVTAARPLVDLRLRVGVHGDDGPGDAVGDARLAPRARLPHEPGRAARGVDRGGRRGVRGLGGAARRPRLRDRRDRDQGRLLRAAGGARLAARRPRFARAYKWAPTAAVTRLLTIHVRVGRTGRAQPAGRARAGAGRRRHRLERDAAQRGRHPPQGHPGRRSRRRPARRRRDPAGGRAGRRARAGHEAVEDAEALPALQRPRSSSPQGEVMHRCPNRACPSRGLETLYHWVGSAMDIEDVGCEHAQEAVGRGARPLAAGPLPADRRAAGGARGVRGDLRGARDRVDRALEGAAVLARALRPEHPEGRLGDRAQPRAALRLRRCAHRRDAVRARGGRGRRARPGGADRRVVLGRGEPGARRRAPRARDPDGRRRRTSARPRAR